MNNLPSRAKEEAETAIEQGVYENSDSLLLPEVIDPQQSYLVRSRDRSYYSVQIEDEDTSNRIRATEAYPTGDLPQVQYLGEGTIDCEIQVEYAQTYGDATRDEATELLKETVTLGQDQLALGRLYNSEGGTEIQFGTYWITVVSEDLDLSETKLLESQHHSETWIHIESSGVSIHRGEGPDNKWPCAWDSSGDLLELTPDH
mgnify:FL=1